MISSERIRAAFLPLTVHEDEKIREAAVIGLGLETYREVLVNERILWLSLNDPSKGVRDTARDVLREV